MTARTQNRDDYRQNTYGKLWALRQRLADVLLAASSWGLVSLSDVQSSGHPFWATFRDDIAAIDSYLMLGDFIRNGDSEQNMFSLLSSVLPAMLDSIFKPRGYTFEYIATYLRSNAFAGLWSTKGEAEQARAAVSVMNDSQRKLPANLQSQFQPQVDAINKAWKRYDEAWVFYTHEQAISVGKLAQELTAEMSKAAPGVVKAPTTTVGGGSVDDALKQLGDKAGKFLDSAGVVVLVGVGLLFATKAASSYGARPASQRLLTT